MSGGDRICGKVDCGARAIWRVGFTFVLRGYEHAPCPAYLGLGVCDEHRASAKLEDFLSDDGWAGICEGFRAANRPPPTRELTTLRFEPIGTAPDPSKWKRGSK